jgi:hypothetical protein
MSTIVELPVADALLPYFEALFEELPMAAFVLDEEVRITDFNRAAFVLMDADSRDIDDLLVGDAFGCANAPEPGGCGTTSNCNQCVLRRSVQQTFASGQCVRGRGVMTLRRRGRTVSQEFVAATAMIAVGDHQSVLLTVQTLGELL